MNSTKQAARIAGLLYLVNGATGFFGIIYVPSILIVSGNTAATPETSSPPRGFSASVSSPNWSVRSSLFSCSGFCTDYLAG